MSMNLHPIDLLIGAAYLAGTTLLALGLARRQRGLKSYFVGDRNVAWWLVLGSIVATETSTVTFLSTPGLSFDPTGGNLWFLQLALGFAVGRVLVAWLLMPQFLRGELFSAYQVLRERFDAGVQRTASGIFLLARSVGDGLRLCLTAMLMQQVLGWGIVESVVLTGAVTLFYTYLGGMKAVLWTDLLQLVIYLSGGIVAAVVLVQMIPGGLETYLAVGAAADRFQVVNLTPTLQDAKALWPGIVGGAFLSMASHGADQLMVQRYLCARSLAQARLALVLSGVFVFLQFALFLLIGVGLYVLYLDGQIGLARQVHVFGIFEMNLPPARDQAFGLFIIEKLPVGVVGLVVSAVLAAAMSTLSSSFNSSANAFVTDFYRPLRPERDEEHYLHVSRVMTAVWGIVQIGVALAAFQLVRDESIITHVLTVAGFTTGAILGLFLLGSRKRPVGSRAAQAGLAVGFLAALAMWAPTALGTPLIAWPLLAPLGTLVTVVVGLVVDRIL